jgi:rhodanese-related sulfurtransferase
MLSTDQILQFDGVVLDVRSSNEYGRGHIPKAINIWLAGQFASWTGTMIPIGTPIAIAADTQEQVDEAFVRLARVGHDTATGFILMKDFTGDLKTVDQIPAERARELVKDGIQFIDVRRVAEYSKAHATGAFNLPLDKLPNEIEKLDPDKPTFVICQSGYRSSLATSVLENAGFKTICNVAGGTSAWIGAGLETESSETACGA